MSVARIFAPEVTEELLTQSFNVRYDYEEKALQLFGSGSLPINYIQVEGPTLLSFTTESDPESWAFNERPIEWVLGDHDYQLSSDLKTLYVLAGKPSSLIMPLAFVLSADFATLEPDPLIKVPGVRSTTILIVQGALSNEPLDMKLSYNTETGVFSLQEGWPLQPGQLLLLPGTSADQVITLNVSLVDHHSSALNFAPEPIGWLDGNQPPWIEHSLSDGILRLTSRFSYLVGEESFQSSQGLAAPFHFNILYNGIVVRSPDPIIMNTTLGDG
jgi:hypothetical protein